MLYSQNGVLGQEAISKNHKLCIRKSKTSLATENMYIQEQSRCTEKTCVWVQEFSYYYSLSYLTTQTLGGRHLTTQTQVLFSRALVAGVLLAAFNSESNLPSLGQGVML